MDIKSANIPLSSNHSIASPLRYPGGKSVLFDFMSRLISSCDFPSITYVEPYAGGAGIALKLLDNPLIKKIVINDLDPNVFAFWQAITSQTDDFLTLLDTTPVTMEERERQKKNLREESSMLEKGFAFFFLNRTNMSGLINGGVIGGRSQKGKYRIDARFNKEALKAKIEKIGLRSSLIEIENLDGKKVIRDYINKSNTFIYADPPYVEKGKSLYMNSFSTDDHADLANVFNSSPNATWILTYDDTELIQTLYSKRTMRRFSLKYCAAKKRVSDELLISSDLLATKIEEVLSIKN